MLLKDLKSLAESFRNVGGDKAQVKSLADATTKANAGDYEVCDLCDRFVAAPDATAVGVIADEVKARKI